MKLDRLPFLYVVPHDDLLGREAQHAFTGQMVPAGDRKNVANAEFDGRAGQVDLRRFGLEEDERRDNDEIRVALAQILMKVRSGTGRLLENVEEVQQQPAARRPECFGEQDDPSWRPLAGSIA